MADPTSETLTRLANDVASGALTVPIAATYPLEQVAEAFAAFGAGTIGKIAVAIDQPTTNPCPPSRSARIAMPSLP